MAESTESTKRPIKVFVAAVAIALLLLALLTFRFILLAALVGVIGGVLLEPLIRWLQVRCRVPHGVGVVLVVILILGAGIGVGYGVYAMIVEQAQRLAEQGPAILERLGAKIDQLVQRFSWLGLDPNQLDLNAVMQQTSAAVIKGLRVGAEGITGAVVVFMIAVFVAANFDAYTRGALSLFPPTRRKRVNELGRGSVRVVRQWFVGQMFVVAISGTLTAIAMASIGVDYWLLIALLTVVLDFVPFFGALITGALAMLLTLGTEPEKVWWVLLAYVAIQQIETDVTLPLVMKGRIKLPEAHLLVFLLIMGSAFGVVGVFVSPPLFAVLHHLYVAAYVPWVEGRRVADGARREAER